MDTIINALSSKIKDPSIAKEILKKIRNIEINVLLIGGTGVGKSSTINALFQSYGEDQKEPAKVGKLSPETMDILPYKLGKLVIWDTPGLGESTEKDAIHSKNISAKLREQGPDQKPLIDLVFLVLDGGSRDYSSAYRLIKEAVLPNIAAEEKNRILIGINKADMALHGRHWDSEKNQPQEKLMSRLDELNESVKSRIKSETDIDVEPIYYVAGYKDEEDEQLPYNLQKLLSFILTRLPEKKRATISDYINPNEENFQFNDKKEDYEAKVESSILSSITLHIKNFAAGALNMARDVLTDPKVQETIKTSALALFQYFVKKKLMK